ncbi:four helix bundle protein [Capnocytophaga canis]|uniref:four helix bundle protein n=1 Tax=Capnocytophaga canis TaxID=1848903 RepID=UPI001561BC25
MALSSLSELDTQIEIAFRQKYIENTEILSEKVLIIKKQLLALIKSLKLKLK